MHCVSTVAYNHLIKNLIDNKLYLWACCHVQCGFSHQSCWDWRTSGRQYATPLCLDWATSSSTSLSPISRCSSANFVTYVSPTKLVI